MRINSQLTRKLVGLALSFLLLGAIAYGVPSGLQGRHSKASSPYEGTWSGSYATEGGGSGDLSYDLSKDEKGQWRGTVRFTNQDGEQKADFKTLQIANGKLTGSIESPDGKAEVSIQGTFQGNKMQGSYTVMPKGSNDTAEKGTWNVTKKEASK